MKKLIWIAVFGCLGLGIWQWIGSFMGEHSLQQTMQVVLDNAKTSESEEIKVALQERAKSQGMDIRLEDIQVEMRMAQGGGPASNMVQSQGIQTLNKTIIVKVQYPYKILFLRFSRPVVLAQSYTISASMPQRNYEQMP